MEVPRGDAAWIAISDVVAWISVGSSRSTEDYLPCEGLQRIEEQQLH